MDIYFDQRDFDIKLTDDIEGVDLVILTDPVDKLMQRLFKRLKTQKRDIVWNLSYGIDYLQDVFGRKKPKGVVDVIIQDEIKKEPMVKEIVRFESEIVDFKYACKFSVSIIDEPSLITYYILTNESGIILTNESGDILTIRL